MQHKCLFPCLKQVEVSVELRTLGVFQTFKLTGYKQEDVLDTKKQIITISGCVDDQQQKNFLKTLFIVAI